jgi:UDP-glucose 6-dehydrogenase
VFDGLHPDRVILSGNSLSAKKLYLLYDRDNGHYNVITTLNGAIAKKYICNACDMLYDFSQKCDNVCSLCTVY